MLKQIKNLKLCDVGIHRPLKNHRDHFVDTVSLKMVYRTECPCGRRWMVDSRYGFLGDKVENEQVCF